MEDQKKEDQKEEKHMSKSNCSERKMSTQQAHELNDSCLVWKTAVIKFVCL